MIEKNNIRACSPIFHALFSLSLFLIVILHISCLRCRHKKIYLYYSILFPIIYFLHHTSLRIFILLTLFRIFSWLSHSPISLVQFLSFSLSFLVFIFCLFPSNTYSHILLLVYFLVFFSHIAHISSLCLIPFFIYSPSLAFDHLLQLILTLKYLSVPIVLNTLLYFDSPLFPLQSLHISVSFLSSTIRNSHFWFHPQSSPQSHITFPGKTLGIIILHVTINFIYYNFIIPFIKSN